MSLKRKLRDLGIATLAAVTFTTGCAFTNYDSRYSERDGQNASYEYLMQQDGKRTGLEIIPQSVKFFEDIFRIEGISSEGRQISVYEDLDDSNYNLLVNISADLKRIIDLNSKSPNGHPLKGIYVTGKYDHKIDTNDILELETVNVNGDLYYTDPANNSRLATNVGFEFWNQPWWRDYNQAHYPIGLRPWWDQNRTGIINNYHLGISNPNGDWDGDGISNWAESCMGTNPYNRDSDYDGLDDLMELWFGTNPLDRDSDNDGYWDGEDPFPLWHSRHHRNHPHRHWDLWWTQNYDNMRVRHKIRERPVVPGERWRTKPGRDSERIRYKKKLNTREETIRSNVGRRDYLPRESQNNSRRIYNPKQEEIRSIPERKTPERRVIQPERRVQPKPREIKPKSREIKPKTKTKERETKKTKSSRQKTKSGSRRTR